MTIKKTVQASILAGFIFSLYSSNPLHASLKTNDASTVVKLIQKDGAVLRVLSVENSLSSKGFKNPRKLQSIPMMVSEDAASSIEIFEEWVYPNSQLPKIFQQSQFKTLAALPNNTETDYESSAIAAQKEFRTLIDQGPAANRICLTLVGDGYTLAEKEKFFSDSARLTKELFVGQTFASYLPLFNVYAVFIPSKESGLSDGKKKDTALGLYRAPAGSKRGIMPGNVSVIESTLKLAPKTDFPILIANDDYYGGLGGRYAITTRSERSGIIVLRHELGHNFGVVGEEYDGGYAYFGANSSSNLNVDWAPWLTETKGVEQAGLYLLGGYLWTNLSNGKQSLDFDLPAPTSGTSYTYAIELSTVGWETSKDVRVTLDHQVVDAVGDYTNDRAFLKIQTQATLAPGSHHLEFEEVIHDGDNVLGFAQVFAYPDNYNFNSSAISAYRTYDSDMNLAGYRPTHDQCLMRDMLKTDFCSVDKENMWIRFLQRIQLIDDLAVMSNINGSKTISLKTPKLNGLQVHWYKSDGGSYTELVDRKNQLEWTLPSNTSPSGAYQVKVEFQTSEVRTSTSDFTVTQAFNL